MKAPLPEAFLPKHAPITAWRQAGWRTLDRREGIRQGVLTEAAGADPRALPALSPLPTPTRMSLPSVTGRVISMQVLDGVVYAVTEKNGLDTLWVFRDIGYSTYSLHPDHTGMPRTILPFTHYSNPSDPLDTEESFPMVLILPDGYYLRPDQPNGELLPISEDGTFPPLTHACAYLSRLFGVGEDRAYASNYNNVHTWTYDTAEAISASHAWVTTSQSGGERSAGYFTAILPFSGMLLAFKTYSCYVIRGNKSPFRLTELLSVGTFDARTVAQVGTSLFFCDFNRVYRYDGSEVREIGAPLGVTDLFGALGAAGGSMYYLYVPLCHKVFVYATDTGAWSELYPFTPHPIRGMASNGAGECLFLDSQGDFYTTRTTEAYRFAVKTSELIPDLSAPARLLRVRVTARLEEEASLSVSCCLSDGRILPLTTIAGEGRTLRQSIPIPAVADSAASLLFEGNGKISITSLDLVTAATATDGT